MPLNDPRMLRRSGEMGVGSQAGIAGPSGWGTMDVGSTMGSAGPGGFSPLPPSPPPEVFSGGGMMPGGNLGMRVRGGQFGGDMTGVAGPSSIASQFSQVPPAGGPGNIAQRLRRGGYTGMGRGRGRVARNPNMVGTAVRRPETSGMRF